MKTGLGDASLGQGECGSENAWPSDPGQAGEWSSEPWALSAASPGWSWAKGPQEGPFISSRNKSRPRQPQRGHTSLRGHTILRTSFPTHGALHTWGPRPQSCPPLPTPSPHRLLPVASPQPALPPPLPAHRAISLPSFQYFLLVVRLRTKSRGDSTALYLTSSFLPLTWPDQALIEASSRASVPAASSGS